MPLTSEEADMIRPGEVPLSFVPGGELTMRPSNMGIPAAAIASVVPAAPSSGREPSPGGTTSDAESPSAPPSQLRRINEGEEAVPGSQDSDLALRAQQLRISVPPSVSFSSAGRRRSHQQMATGSAVLLRCAMCGPAPGAFQASGSRGLLQHLCRSLRSSALRQSRNCGT